MSAAPSTEVAVQAKMTVSKMTAHQQIDSYIEEKLNSYVTYNTLNSNLWEQFQHDFKDFAIDALKSVTLRSIQNLRDCLLSRGVSVTKDDKRKTIVQALFECITEDYQHQWTEVTGCG
ncbi:hypothetical protein K3495_g5814 [Podosphaera aphanis]|nr:hypothetical protein K3495_g5814 [Podosphaera aphanis]